MQLEHVMTLTAILQQPIGVKESPTGLRRFIQISGGTFQGSFDGKPLEGKLLPAGGDWFVKDHSSFAHINVRAVLQTNDGDHIFASYRGKFELNEAVFQARGAEMSGTNYGDNYFIVLPTLETGAEVFQNINHTAFVGEGRLTPDGVEYQMYRVMHG